MREKEIQKALKLLFLQAFGQKSAIQKQMAMINLIGAIKNFVIQVDLLLAV